MRPKHVLKAAGTILALVLALSVAPFGHAQDTFVIEDIRLEGLQRISPGTVFNYLPLQIGDEMDAERSAEAIRALFRTGFFEDVRLEREGGTLLVSLVERPSIASVDFEGNRTITTEVLSAQLAQVDFEVGRVFNRSVFDRVEQELRRAYFANGRYGVRIKTTVTPLERNRVAVHFDVAEGRVAKIKRINVVGNQAFEEGALLDLFQLSSTGVWSLFTRSDQYSKQEAGRGPGSVALALSRPGFRQLRDRLHPGLDKPRQEGRLHHDQRHRRRRVPGIRGATRRRSDRRRVGAVRAGEDPRG